jgi:hypothetical protein
MKFSPIKRWNHLIKKQNCVLHLYTSVIPIVFLPIKNDLTWDRLITKFDSMDNFTISKSVSNIQI